MEGFIGDLVEREIVAISGAHTVPMPWHSKTWDDVLEPVRREFDESGMGEEELTRFLTEVRDEVRQAKRARFEAQSMVRELESIVLVGDLPEHGLGDDDIGTVVQIHSGGSGYEVEFMTLDGQTVAVVSLPASPVRRIARREIAHARMVG